MELLVYKASAGSGKTFTLAVEYIKLLIINPRAYRNILAVTFTNKATGEMKERILQQLYGIWKETRLRMHIKNVSVMIWKIMQKTIIIMITMAKSPIQILIFAKRLESLYYIYYMITVASE